MTEYVTGGINFPLMDSDRDYANREYSRYVIAECGYLEPYVAEMDSWVTMPLRVVVDDASGINIEIGPYSVNEQDIRLLQNVLRTYYENVNRGRLRLIDGEGGQPA